MVQIADNFSYRGPKPNFERDAFQTLADMKAVVDGTIDDGHVSYCFENQTHYDYLGSRTSDATTGKWRVWRPVDSALSETSENAVQNKVIQAKLKEIKTNFDELKNDVDSIVIDETLSDTSTNAIQNKTVKSALDAIGLQISGLVNTAKELEKTVVKKGDIDTALSATSENPVQNKAIQTKLADIDTQLNNLKTKVDAIPPIDTALSATSTNPVQNKAVTAAINDLKSRMDQAEFEITGLKYFGSYSYCVADWSSTDRLKPTANDMYGDPELLQQWDFYLVDHTSSPTDGGSRLKPEAKLNRNNILRDVKGNFAPVVFTNLSAKGRYVDSDGATKSAFATNVQLYTDSNCTAAYVMSNAFDSAKFIKDYGKTAKLYVKKSNNQPAELFDIPRPWEEYQESNTGFSPLRSVVMSLPQKVYLLDQLEGKSGKIWKGIFYEPCIWDGIDVSKYPLDTTGIFPSPATSVVDDSKDKMFCRYVGLYKNGVGNLQMSSNSQGHAGEGSRSTIFCSDDYTISGQAYKKGVYGRSYDVSQLTNCTFARNNNSNTQNPVPFAEGGYHSRNTFVSSQETLYKTKFLNNSTFFASGISANDAVGNETQWRQFGGIRWRQVGNTNWSYGTWNTTPSDICYNTTGGKTHFNALLSWWFPKEQCMESQTYASYAYEMGIAPGVEFQYDSDKDWWSYKNIPGTMGLADGEMNCIIYKRMPRTISFFNTSGSATNFEIEVILRMSLMNGYNHSGDYWIYYGGGYEQVGTVTNATNGTTGNPVEIYTAFDQKDWRSRDELQTVTRDNLGTFVFESDPNYVKVWEGVNLGDSYTEIRPPYTAYKSKAGGSLSTGECFWSYTAKHWSTTLNQRIRVGVGSRFSNNFRTGDIRLLWMADASALAVTNKYLGGSGQVLLDLEN